VEQSILSFFESDAKVTASSQAMMDFRSYTGHSQRVPRQMTAVHVAAYFGLREAMMALLKNGYNLNVKDTYDRTPLS
jgi:hypothetical protein